MDLVSTTLPRTCIVTLFAMLSLSCEYSPTGEAFQDLPEPVHNVDFTILDSAHINVLRGNARINFHNILSGHRLYSFVVVVDGHHTYYPSTSDDCFILNTTSFPDGNHDLKFVLQTSTGSGSIADLVGAEHFLVERTYQMLSEACTLQHRISFHHMQLPAG